MQKRHIKKIFFILTLPTKLHFCLESIRFRRYILPITYATYFVSRVNITYLCNVIWGLHKCRKFLDFYAHFNIQSFEISPGQRDTTPTHSLVYIDACLEFCFFKTLNELFTVKVHSWYTFVISIRIKQSCEIDDYVPWSLAICQCHYKRKAQKQRVIKRYIKTIR